jgi:hypothetical protein
MSSIIRQGLLRAGNSVLFVVPNNKSYKTSLISCTNTSAFTIELQKYDATEGNTVTLCKFNLAAGDTLLNTTPYPFDSRDRLILTSSVSDTNYIVSLEESK